MKQRFAGQIHARAGVHELFASFILPIQKILGLRAASRCFVSASTRWPQLRCTRTFAGAARWFRRGCDILPSVSDALSLRCAFTPGDSGMKALGFLMLLAGWFLVLAAVVLFQAPPPRAAFVLIGLAVEALGLVLAFRSHLIPREGKR
jgi:hypothetical protein